MRRVGIILLMMILLSSVVLAAVEVNMSCDYNPTPVIRMGSDSKIEWLCTITKVNVSEQYSCTSSLYDAYNGSYLIQVNPSYDDFKSKTTLIGGGEQNTELSRYFTESKGLAIIYFDGGFIDDIKPTKLLEGRVNCMAAGEYASFLANFTPRYADYNDEWIFRGDVILSNTNILLAGFILLLFTGLLSGFVWWAWSVKR